MDTVVGVIEELIRRLPGNYVLPLLLVILGFLLAWGVWGTRAVWAARQEHEVSLFCGVVRLSPRSPGSNEELVRVVQGLAEETRRLKETGLSELERLRSREDEFIRQLRDSSVMPSVIMRVDGLRRDARADIAECEREIVARLDRIEVGVADARACLKEKVETKALLMNLWVNSGLLNLT
jgi:hypothetical protein